MDKFLNDLLYYLFYIFYLLVKYTPKRLKKYILNLFFYIIYYGDFFRKKVVFKNLHIAFPDKSDKEITSIAKEFYKNFITYMADIIENIDITEEKLKEKVTIKGEENLLFALNSKKPVVLMTAHFGNWELAPKYIGAFYTPMVVLMREFDNKKLGDFFKKSRNRFNISTLNKKASAREIVKAIKSGKALGVLIDQHSTGSAAVEVEFFNQKVKFNRAISTLSKKFNAVVVPFFTYRENEKYVLEFLPPRQIKDESIEEFTQWQAKVIEEMIKKHPSEYYWFHKRFKLTVKY